MNIVLFFCSDTNIDPVASSVLRKIKERYELSATDIYCDGNNVLSISNKGVNFQLVEIDKVLCHDYQNYYEFVNNNFSNHDVLIVVNWHEGQKAPEAIFTVQTTGDMASGHFSPIDPSVTLGLFRCIETGRKKSGLDKFKTWMEATHWSGVVNGNQPGSHVSLIKPSVIDLEIGSYPADWSNDEAQNVIADNVLDLGAYLGLETVSVLCVGGTHFDPSFNSFVGFNKDDKHIAVSHMLPNHWLISGGYDDDSRIEYYENCIQSIHCGVDYIIYKDKLKSNLKSIVNKTANKLDIECMTHKKFKNLLLERGYSNTLEETP